MAKIKDIINEMESLLSGKDLSNTPQGRQQADTYAEICADVNSSLEECRTMLRMGAYSEAKKQNDRANPPFTERLQILNFSRRTEWVELCELYGWTLPPALDEETAAELLSQDKDKILSIEELQNQWRGIIREGTLREKLTLARKIYALEPSKVWRSNLLNVERPWINELKNAADVALAENNADELSEIYKEQISPDILEKVPESSLKKYLPLINQHNLEQQNQEKKQALADVASCYAAMMVPELESALTRWSHQESHPLFSQNEDERLQIAEAKKFLLERQAEMNADEMAMSLQNQQECLLNDEKNPEEIDRVYHSLQQLDRPIKPLLEERMKDLHARMAQEARRLHLRRCLYWGGAAAIFAAVIFTGIFLFQREFELRKNCAKIREMLEQRHFEAAIQYCVKIEQERPRLAKRPALIALRKEAESLRAEAEKASKQFDSNCDELEKQYLNEENVLHPAVKHIFDELDRLKNLLPEERHARLVQNKKNYEELLKTVQMKMELELDKKFSEQQKKWTVFFNEFDALPEGEATKQAAEQLQAATVLLKQYQEKISEEKFKNYQDLQNSYNEMFKQREADKIKLQARLSNLLHPSDPFSYFTALEDIATFSKKYETLFEDAIKQLPREKVMFQLTYPYKREKLLAAGDPLNPFYRDLFAESERVDSKPDWAQKQAEKLKNMEEKTLSSWKIHELKMQSEGRTFFIYFEKPEECLDIERSWDGSRIKSIRMTFLTTLENPKQNAVFLVKTQSVEIPKDKELKKKRTARPKYDSTNYAFVNVLEFMPGQIYESFPKLLIPGSWDLLLDPGKAPLVPHYRELENVLATAKIDQKTDTIFNMILKISEDKSITNPYAKARLLLLLTDLLPMENNPLYLKNLDGFMQLLQKFTQGDRAEWCDPANMLRYPEDAADFEKEFQKLNLKAQVSKILFSELMLKTALKYPPRPVGILYLENHNWRLHSFGEKLLGKDEQFIYAPVAKNKKELFTYSFSPLKFASNVPEDELPDTIRGKVYNGTLVYSAAGCRTWAEVFRDIRKKMENMKYEIPQNNDGIFWPDFWPQNVRNIAELQK